MNIEHSPFVSLLIVASLAVIVPILLTRLRRITLPIVVGEIIAGIIIGQSGIRIISPDEPILDFLAEFGLVFLMFLSGMEIDFSNLGFITNRNIKRDEDKRPRNPIFLAVINFCITLTLSFIIGWAMKTLGLVRDAWMMGLILSTTSLGVVVPVLKERRIIGGRYGQTILITALIADFVTMLMITIEVAALSHGLTLNIFLIGFLFLAFFLFYRFGKRVFHNNKIKKIIDDLSHATAQIKIRVAFAIMLIFVVLSEFLGTEVILGAFLAGVILALLKTPSDSHVSSELETFGYGFLIPIFFIKVGIDFNFSALLNSPNAIVLAPILIILAIAIKVISSLVFKSNFSIKETFAAGFLLSSRLSLIIAASAIGTKLGVISSSINADLILVAITTVTISPIIFNKLLPDRNIDEQAPVIIVGAGSLGIQVAKLLISHQEKVVLIDHDIERVETANKNRLTVVHASITNNDLCADEYLQKAQTLICVFSDSDLNYQICQIAKVNYGINNIVAQVTNPGELSRFEQLGVRTLNAAIDRAPFIMILARYPSIYDLLIRTDDNKEVCEVRVGHRNYINKQLKQLSLPGDVLIMALRRHDEMLIPHGNTRLQIGDYITLSGTNDCIEIARKMFSGY